MSLQIPQHLKALQVGKGGGGLKEGGVLDGHRGFGLRASIIADF
jgi:hypothetical protein